MLKRVLEELERGRRDGIKNIQICFRSSSSVHALTWVIMVLHVCKALEFACSAQVGCLECGKECDKFGG